MCLCLFRNAPGEGTLDGMDSRRERVISRAVALAALALLSVAAGRPHADDLPADSPPVGGPPVDDEAEKAQSVLDKAELRIEQGRCVEAVRLYKSLARKYPETEAGRIGARRSEPSAYIGSKLIVDNGASTNRVDVALMGDGYTLEHQKAFAKLAADIPPLFERQDTFREYYSYFNFRCFYLVSKDDNVDGFGREEDTALDGHTRGTIQGHVGVDPLRVKAMLGEVEEHDDLAIVFVRVGALGTGGSGIATIGGRSASTTIHEWGHAFGRLGDEYSSKTHDRGGVSNRANVSRNDDPQKVPWSHWIAARVPGVGVYEGANGQVRGAWKPTASGCVMLNGEFFCRPCREALVLRIYSIVDPIESTNHPPHPRNHPASLKIEDSFEFRVEVMRPAKHNLEVSWWVLPEHQAPPDPRSRDGRYAGRHRDRRGRGPLPRIPHDPLQVSRVKKSGVHELEVRARKLAPGRYRVICRAKDTTKLRGEKYPWVLKDEYGVLESERAWWIEIPE